MFNVQFKIWRNTFFKWIGFLFFLLIFLPTVTLAEQERPAGFYASVFTGILIAEFPINYYLDPYKKEIRLDDWETENSIAVSKPISNISYGLSLGYSYKLVSVGKLHVHLYGELSFCPKFKFANETENVRQLQQDSYGRRTYQTIQYNQTERNANIIALKAGFILFPFRKIPLGINTYFVFCRFHQKYVSGAINEYEDEVDIDPLRDADVNIGGDYKGNGIWEKNRLGFGAGMGLKYYFLKHFSLDLILEGSGFWRTKQIKKFTGGGFYTTQNISVGYGNLIVSLGLTFYI